MSVLEDWTEKQLVELGVDHVFAPYICGMLTNNEGALPPHEIKAAIADVMLGWTAPEDADRVHHFVDDLWRYHVHPSQLLAEIHAASGPLPGLKANERGILVSGGPLLNPEDAAGREEREAPLLIPSSHRSLSPPPAPWLNAAAPTFIPASASPIRNALKGASVSGSPTTSTSGHIAPAFYPAASEPNSDPSFEYASPSAYEEHFPAPASLESGEGESALPVYHDTNDQEIDPDTLFIWQIEEQLLESLLQKFSSCSPAALTEIMRICDYDYASTEAALQAILEREQSGIQQVCRHYMHGECRRADCQFLHETSSITCRFWLRGSCVNAESCPFMHGYDPVSNRDAVSRIKDEIERDEPPDVSSVEKFPSLGSANGRGQASSAWADGRKLLGSSTKTVEPIVGGGKKAGARPVLFDSRSWSNRQKVQQGDWISTGETVSKEYSKLRAEASQLAKARNQCFMNATAAFRGGQKGLAKELSQRGQEYNAKMKERHLQAAQAIFSARNPSNQIREQRLLDLHGLHVAEAVALLESLLPQLSEEGLPDVKIVTGSGHHSKGSNFKARLKPAVERFLSSEGYEYAEVADKKGHIGMLMVNLTW